jgi:hypothetical protein
MQDKPFQNRSLLYFDNDYTTYTCAIKSSFEKQGGRVDFFTYSENTRKTISRIIKNINKNLFYRRRIKRLYDILDSVKNKRYDIILIKSPFSVPHEFFENLNTYFPNIPKVNYNWSSVAKFNFLSYKQYFDIVYSFDPIDCAKYNLTYCPLFFIDNFFIARKLRENIKSYNFDIAFIGSAASEGRYDFLKKFQNYAEYRGLKTYFYVYQGFFSYLKNTIRGNYIPNVRHKYMPINRVIENIIKSRTVIDYPMDIQAGLTIRTFETLGAGIKLITTNQHILNEPFYDKDCILVLTKDMSNLDTEFIFNSEDRLAPYIDNYHIDNWLKNILLNKL